MSISEKDYNKLSDTAYWIDPKHKDYDSKIKEGNIREIAGKEYKILKVEDNSTNGMQAMAVAPIKNGIPDTSEIIIAFAGTNASDRLDILTDTQTVVAGNKGLDVSSWWKSPERVDGQIHSAENFVKGIKSTYPTAAVTTTGHSLGEYIALYIAAENGWMNVGFNGPDPYNILSKTAKDWTKNNPGMLFNYRSKGDFVNATGNGTGAAIPFDQMLHVGLADTLDLHNLSNWKFDKEGRLLIRDTPENKKGRQIQAEKFMYAQLIGLSILAKKLKASGGGLSAGEEIYLNDSQALIAVESASQAMKIGLESVIEIYQDGISEAEKVWDEGLKRARSFGSALEEYEVLDALADGGATQATIVNEPTAYYEEKMAKARKIGESFDSTIAEIKASIDVLKKADKNLASQLN